MNIIDSVELNLSGTVYTLQMGEGSGVTSGEVQTMMEDYTYDKPTIDDKIAEASSSGDIITISGDVITISGDVIELSESLDKVSGDVIVLSGDVSALEGKIDALSGALDDKQDKLISGTNIKTINGQSLLGSGDIEISGGTGGKAIVAGRGIKVTTGETADTVEFDLPIYSGRPYGESSAYYDFLRSEKRFSVGRSSMGSMAYNKNTKFSVSQNNGDVSGADDFVVSDDGRIFIDDYHSRGIYGVRQTYCLQDKLDSLQPILSAGTGVDITDNVISVTGGGITSGEVQTMIDESISGKADNADLVIVSGDVIALSGAVIDNEEVVARALNDLNDKKAESGDVVDIVSAYTYSKNEIDEKVASGGGISYSAGTGIDITNNVISSTLNAYNGTGVGSLIIGQSANTASGDYSVAIGAKTEALGGRSFAQGLSGKTTNTAEITFGQLNDTKNAYVGFGHSGNTLFTIGNGAGIDGSTTDYARHNALEVRSNGDIYIPEPSKVNPSHYYQAPMIKLQDKLAEIDNKPNAWCGTQAEYDAISVKDPNTIYMIHD